MDRMYERTIWAVIVLVLLWDKLGTPRIRVDGPGQALRGGRAVEVPAA